MRRWLLPVACVLLVATRGQTCSIPVFRYALERWELTPYEITVFHREALAAEVAALLGHVEAGATHANVKLKRVDVEQSMLPEVDKLWRRQRANTLPWLVARLAGADETHPDAFAGPLTAASLRQLLDSKARQTIVGHLSRGVSAVFVVLQSGDGEDAAAANLLDATIAKLTPLVRLPEPSADGPQLLTSLPLKAEFVTVALRRDDPAEQVLVRMLLASEPDLDRVRGPIVFPIFGRGRALCSVFGEDLAAKPLEGVVHFLCGECSCTVKELNPGVDLLLAADWAALLQKVGATHEAPPAPRPARPTGARSSDTGTLTPATRPQFTGAVPSTSDTTPGSETPTEAAASDRWTAWYVAIAAAGALVVITGAWAFAPRR